MFYINKITNLLYIELFTGPLLIAFGGLLSVGDIVVIGITIQQYSKKDDRTAVKSANT